MFNSIDDFADAVSQKPSDAYFSDDRAYFTHFPVMHCATNGDDLISESNFATILPHLEAVAANTEHPGACCWDDNDNKIVDAHSDDVYDDASGHWAFGAVQTAWVRMYQPCNFCHQDVDKVCGQFFGDNDSAICLANNNGSHVTTFTEAFTEAFNIFTGLQDYPLFDDSDYSEREWAHYLDTYQEALNCATMGVLWGDFDTEEDINAIRAIAQNYEMDSSEAFRGSEGADYNIVAAQYYEAREEYFTNLGQAFLTTQIDGQTSITV